MELKNHALFSMPENKIANNASERVFFCFLLSLFQIGLRTIDSYAYIWCNQQLNCLLDDDRMATL